LALIYGRLVSDLDKYGFMAAEIIPFLAKEGIDIRELSEKSEPIPDNSLNNQQAMLQAEIERLQGELSKKGEEIEQLKKEVAHWKAKAETPDYLDPENSRYAPKLAATVRTW